MTNRIQRLYNARGTDFIEVIYIETETGTFVQAVGGGQVITAQPVPDSNPYTNPLTTQGDLLVGGAAGVQERLGVGSAAQVLTIYNGVPTWRSLAIPDQPDVSGFLTNPMTTAGDLVVGEINGSEARIPIGTEGQILAVVDGIPTWIDPVISGMHTTILTCEGSLLVTSSPIRIYNSSGTNRTISKVFASINTAPTGASVILDIHKSGTTIFTTQTNRPEILATTFTAQTITIESPTWADSEYLTLHIDQVGSTISGADLTVHIIWS